MTSTPTSLAKFQGLLRGLFQFDQADLDFGIYRILNHKRDVVEQFITDQLPTFVADELGRGPLAQQAQAEAHRAEVEHRVRTTLGETAIDNHGNLASEHHGLPIGREYLEAQARAADGGRSRDAVEAAIYNHLWTFFSRYYSEGDFISQRRYSCNQRYAIPYNGEEVYLHWANSDQYYVKTDEHFRNYSYQAPNGVTVHFRLKNADVEQNNVKGDRRFFIPCVEETELDVDAAAVTIAFEYRPLSGSEAAIYGRSNQQDTIVSEAVSSVVDRLRDNAQAVVALTSERRRTEKGEPVSHLEHHLRQYVRRNNSDFFIHKDLAGFLNRELDFYLKNEVLNLDNLTVAGEDMAEGWFQQMRLTKAVAGKIIDFLAQIEDFQKLLWEKRKFVTETQYCITIGNIAPGFYPDILSNEAQWEEWRELFGIDGSDRSEAFLQAHATLVLDTKHFETEFVDRLVAAFSELDEMTDGLLVHSENWQALRLLEEKYRRRVTCVHIDPPYNTQTSGFMYKNGYQHSSWLAMMRDRISLGESLLAENGSLLCHIDENEYERLHLALDSLPVPSIGTVVWDKRNPMTGGGGIATQHEYISVRSRSSEALRLRDVSSRMILDEADRLVARDGGVLKQTRSDFSRWVSKNDGLGGGEKAYRYLDDAGRVYSSVSLRAPEPRTDPKFFKPLLHPTTGKPCPVPPNGFSRTPETLNSMLERGEILFGRNEATQPRQKRFLKRGTQRQLTSVIQDATRGKSALDALGLEDFPYCHSVSFYVDLLGAATLERDDLIADYFAGSGTTGHAVINLNREDGGRRRFILVEMGEYSDTVVLPRIKKVTYSPEWKEGKPQPQANTEETERSPRIVKYIRLESYEDALDSIVFDDTANEQMQFAEESDEYLLKYMLRWETKDNDTLLNPAKLTRPFSYRLRVHANGVKQEREVDLSETFNYLLGLVVQKREVFDNGGRRYLVYRGEARGAPGKRVAVIWRETEGWTEDDFAKDRDFLAKHDLPGGADTVYVNGDSAIPDAKPIEPMFKARMFASVGA